jgi:hypothetical protein
MRNAERGEGEKAEKLKFRGAEKMEDRRWEMGGRKS